MPVVTEPVVTRSPTPSPAPTDAPTRTPSPAPPTLTPSPTADPPPMIGPDAYPPGVNPLTGLAVDDPALLARRPLEVKISNAPPVVRPQSGLSHADLVFEHYAEGGWTRFAAIFYGQGADHVGSVRSARLIDLELPQMYDAVLVFAGASEGVITMIRRAPFYPARTLSPQFGWGEPYFVRFPREGLEWEHTLFTDTADLWAWADMMGVNRAPRLSTPGLSFIETPPPGGIPALEAAIEYARTIAVWEYSPMLGRYQRWSDGVPHADALTGEQLAFANVIILSAYHEEIDILPEELGPGQRSLEIALWGEGPITLLRDGLRYEGLWRRASPTDQLTFIDLEGSVLPLKPGPSFIQVIRRGFEPVTITP